MLESPSQFLCIQTNKKHKDWGKLNLKIDQCFIVTLKHSECNDNDNQDCIMIEQTPDKRSKNNFANYKSEARSRSVVKFCSYLYLGGF